MHVHQRPRQVLAHVLVHLLGSSNIAGKFMLLGERQMQQQRVTINGQRLVQRPDLSLHAADFRVPVGSLIPHLAVQR